MLLKQDLFEAVPLKCTSVYCITGKGGKNIFDIPVLPVLVFPY